MSESKSSSKLHSNSQSNEKSAAIGQVTVQGDYATIVHKRVLPHSLEKVWQALTDPQELRQWMMMTQVKNDARVGGQFEALAGPSQFHSTGRILTWDPPRVFEYEWKVNPVKEMPQGEDAIFRWELTPQGTSTLLAVTYRHLTRQTALGFAPGTHVFLDRLTAQLAQEKLPDWMGRFQAIMGLYAAWK